jgi:hypothetical protein
MLNFTLGIMAVLCSRVLRGAYRSMGKRPSRCRGSTENMLMALGFLFADWPRLRETLRPSERAADMQFVPRRNHAQVRLEE